MNISMVYHSLIYTHAYLSYTCSIKYAEQLRLEQELRRKLSNKHKSLSNQYQLQVSKIANLTHGAKVLNDQLKLMDEKYLNVLDKVGVAHKYQHVHVDSMMGKTTELQLKYATFKRDDRLLSRAMNSPYHSGKKNKYRHIETNHSSPTYAASDTNAAINSHSQQRPKTANSYIQHIDREVDREIQQLYRSNTRRVPKNVYMG